MNLCVKIGTLKSKNKPFESSLHSILIVFTNHKINVCMHIAHYFIHRQNIIAGLISNHRPNKQGSFSKFTELLVRKK